MFREQLSTITLLSITLILLAISCSDSPSSADGSETDEPPTELNAACEDLTIQSDSAQPTDIVTVEGFTSEFGEEAVAWATDPDNPDVEVPIVFFADFSTGLADFAVPVHPINNMDGGEVEIEFVQEDEEFTCPGFTFTIESLEPSPDATEEFIESYGGGLKDILGDFGYDPDELGKLTTEDVDTVAVPFLMAHHALESDIYENNLSAIMNGTAPLLNGQPLTSEQKMLLDALMAKSNLEQSLNEYLSTISPLINDLPKSSRQLQKSDQMSQKALVLESPAYLSTLMKSQRAAEELVTGYTGRLIEASAVATGLFSIAAGIATVGTGGAAAPVAVLSGFASTTITTCLFITRAVSELLPSKLVSFELFATEYSFNEDSEKNGKWENIMTVESNDFKLSATDVIGLIGSGKVLDNKFVKDKVGEMNQQIIEFFSEMNLALLSGYDDSGVVVYEKNQWASAVDIDRPNEQDYYKWEFDFLNSWDGSPPVLAFCTECVETTNGYYPLKAGESELRVEAIAEKFGFPTNPVSTQKISVDPIEIQINPESTTILLEDVKNGEAVDLTATVENANDPSLTWTSDEGYFEIHDDVANNVTYYPPEKLGDYTVTAESITNTGPREGLEPTRSEYARVYVRDEDEDCAHFNPDNAKTVTVEASGSYANTESTEFAITYAFLDADEDSESACGENGSVHEDDISLPWKYEREMSPPFSASINLVGLQDHSNNMTLRIYVDGEVVAEHNIDGFVAGGDIVPDPALTYAE